MFHIYSTVGIIAKVKCMNQTFCTYLANDVTMLVKVFCTCSCNMKTGKPVMILGYKRRWIFKFCFTVLQWHTNASWQDDKLFWGSFDFFRRVIRFTDGLEEISPCKFANVSAPLEFAFKLSSGTQQSDFTYVTKKVETLMKSKFQLH